MENTHIRTHIIRRLLASRHVLLVSHRGPDGDTLGSALALALFLERNNIQFTTFCLDETPPYLQYLPKSYLVGPHHHAWSNPNVDTVVVVDTSDAHHAGVHEYLEAIKEHRANQLSQFPQQPPTEIITIDHHATNQGYGDVNYIESDASSACELVYNILRDANAIDHAIATCLLTGIITDTGSFSNLATTSSSIHAASDLISKGANVGLIQKHALHHRPYNTLKLWGRALERLHEDPRTGMVVTVITHTDILECNADGEAVSGISNLLNGLESAAEKGIMVLSQSTPGVVKGSLRTTSPLIDVSEFAKLYGGGGHKKAAGFSINGTLTYSTQQGYVITSLNNESTHFSAVH